MKHLYSNLNDQKKCFVKKKENNRHPEESNGENFSPRSSVVDRILSYSKALDVRKSDSLEEISMILN